jgi:hypothetical protein
VKAILKTKGLEAASQAAYDAWMAERKNQTRDI